MALAMGCPKMGQGVAVRQLKDEKAVAGWHHEQSPGSCSDAELALPMPVCVLM